MVIRSTFYDTAPGEGVKETEWAASAQSRGPLYGVAGSGDLRLTAHPTTPYAVNLSPGKFWGSGVWDENTETGIVQSVAPARDATRWDLIAARRDWQPTGGGPTRFIAISGSASKKLPDEREKRPGVVDDQPLWLVKWKGGRTQPEEIIDLRCWASNGGVEIADALALDYLASPGAAVKLGNTVWRYDLQANGVWGWDDGNTGWQDCFLGSTAGVPNVRHPGSWQRVNDAPCQARLVAGGTMLQVRGELNYVNTGTPSYLPAEGWPVARVPAGMYPSAQSFITGTSDRYRKSQMFVIQPNGNITIGPGFVGTVAQFNGLAPL